jgi:hypothetical protein
MALEAGYAKAAVLTASMLIMGTFYKEALQAGRRTIDKVRTVSVSYDITQFDHKLLEYSDTHSTLPRDIPAFIASEITTSTGRNILLDTWGTPYDFRPTDDGYLIRSAGPDRVFGTQDDMYILREGNYIESHLYWINTPETLAQPLQDVEMKHLAALKKLLELNTPMPPPQKSAGSQAKQKTRHARRQA